MNLSILDRSRSAGLSEADAHRLVKAHTEELPEFTA